MPKFTIAVTWMLSGEYTNVEANSLEEAKEKVMVGQEEFSEYPYGEYVDDSMLVNDDCCHEENV